MMSFMDYVVHAFGTATDWNDDNSYSSLTATSDALLSFNIPSTLALHVSSLSTANFASSYTLETLGQLDGSVSYLYSSVPLGQIPSQTNSIPLRNLVRGYRDIRLPKLPLIDKDTGPGFQGDHDRKPTLLRATLALPPPSTLTAQYVRRLDADTLLSLSLYSKTVTSPAVNSGPPPASVLAHVQHDGGHYSIEGLGSTDNALLGLRGLWNFGLFPPQPETGSKARPEEESDAVAVEGFTEFLAPASPLPPPVDPLVTYRNRLVSKPSLLSAGAEFYYSPFSHVIGMSTGLRFTTLAPHLIPDPGPSNSNKPLAGTSASLLSTASQSLLAPPNVSHSSFPYTMTLTFTPLTGSISSTYSVRPTGNLAFSSRFDFNFYSWESRYVVGGEIWRSRRRYGDPDPDAVDTVRWARLKTRDWFSPAERALKDERLEREEENVLKVRVDDGWNVKALWTGRVKALLLSAGISLSPVQRNGLRAGDLVGTGAAEMAAVRKWKGSVGLSVAYST